MVWIVLLAAFSLLFGLWGWIAATSRGRSGPLWAIVCALTYFIGIAIVYSLADPIHDRRDDHPRDQGPRDQGPREIEVRREDAPKTVARRPAREPVQDIEHTDEPMHYAPPPPPPPPPPAVAQPIQLSSEAADEKRWRYLCDYHPRISEAVRRVEPLGAEALDELKSAYLALNDATLLPGILRRIEERFGTGQRAPYDPFRQFSPPADDDEPIDLSRPSAVAEGVERNGAASAPPVSRYSRPIRTEAVQAPPPPVEHDREAEARMLAAERDEERNFQRSEPPASVVPAGIAAAAAAAAQTLNQNPPASSAGWSQAAAERATPVNGTPVQQPPVMSGIARAAAAERVERVERKEATTSLRSVPPPPPPPVQDVVEAPPPPPPPPPPPAQKVPEHRTVAPSDLAGARFVETYGNLHLFALADGRVFVDRHEALPSLDLAKQYVDSLKGKGVGA